MTPGGYKPRDPTGPCGQEPSSDQETGKGERGRRQGAPEESSGPSVSTMSLSPWPIRVPRVRVVWSGIAVPKQPARPTGQASRLAAEPPASQVAYSLSKAGLLNLQASL